MSDTRTPAEVFAEHNAIGAKGTTGAQQSAKDQCQCPQCKAVRENAQPK